MRIDTGAKPLERPRLEAQHTQAFGILDIRTTRLRAISYTTVGQACKPGLTGLQ